MDSLNNLAVEHFLLDFMTVFGLPSHSPLASQTRRHLTRLVEEDYTNSIYLTIASYDQRKLERNWRNVRRKNI